MSLAIVEVDRVRLRRPQVSSGQVGRLALIGLVVVALWLTLSSHGHAGPTPAVSVTPSTAAAH